MGQQSSAGGVKRSTPCESNEVNETMPETSRGDSQPEPAPKKSKASDSSTVLVLSYRREVRRRYSVSDELVNDHSRVNRVNRLQIDEEEFTQISVQTAANQKEDAAVNLGQ
ncbi:sperm protein associated with the nucleus on the X chromosome C-like [Pan paniscus]|uniref:sperm protein associated with the nucleus on the X chromosome C-like n=1 Tax=Pan paniscus TaxID=9597 RepID=UPI002436F3AF|nr:sperm protein associated with the nucleus on the X chromosome C-like [Pan paniscus]